MVRYQRYFCEKDRKEAIKKSKTRYMLNKEWICPDCHHDYSLAGKWRHLSTQKHINKASSMSSFKRTKNKTYKK